MKPISLISKNAISQDGKILGEIVRLEGKESAKVIVDQLQVIIRVDRAFHKPDIISLPIKKILSVDENVHFDIPIDEFKKLQQIYRYKRNKKLKDEMDREIIEDGYKKAIGKTLSNRYF